MPRALHALTQVQNSSIKSASGFLIDAVTHVRSGPAPLMCVDSFLILVSRSSLLWSEPVHPAPTETAQSQNRTLDLLKPFLDTFLPVEWWLALQVSAASTLPTIMEALKTALTQFVDHISQTAGVYTSVIVIFVFHVGLEKDLPCTCEDQHAVCWSYLILPAFFIFLFLLWVDKTFQSASTNICRARYKLHFRTVFWIRIGKAACVGSLWVVAVLLDGDWYICCQNHTAYKYLACTDKANNTADEQRTRNQLVGNSMVSLMFLCWQADDC